MQQPDMSQAAPIVTQCIVRLFTERGSTRSYDFELSTEVLDVKKKFVDSEATNYSETSQVLLWRGSVLLNCMTLGQLIDKLKSFGYATAINEKVVIQVNVVDASRATTNFSIATARAAPHLQAATSAALILTFQHVDIVTDFLYPSSDFDPLPDVDGVFLNADIPCKVQQEALKLCEGTPSALRTGPAAMLSANQKLQLEALLVQCPQLVACAAIVVDNGAPDDQRPRTTLLYTAARAGCLDAVKLLCSRGADPNLQVDNDSRSTPMHVACFRGHKECIEHMMLRSRYRVDLNIRNQYRETCTDEFAKDVDGEAIVSFVLDLSAAAQRHEMIFTQAPPLLWVEQLPLDVPAGMLPNDVAKHVQPAQMILPPGKQQHVDAFIRENRADYPDDLENVEDLVDTSLDVKVDCVKCRWFFQGDSGGFELCSAPVQTRSIDTISQYTEQVYDEETSGKFVSRTFDGATLTCRNEGTGNVRSLLHIRDDGVAICGGATALWVVDDRPLQHDGTPAPRIHIPHHANVDLDKRFAEFQQGRCESGSFDVRTNPKVRSECAKRIRVVFDKSAVAVDENGCCVFDAQYFDSHTSAGEPCKVFRFFPTCFSLDDRGTFRSLTPSVTTKLHQALAAGYTVLRDAKYEYDLEQRVMTRIENPTEKFPLIIVRPTEIDVLLQPLRFSSLPSLATAATQLDSQEQRRLMEERLTALITISTADQLRDKLSAARPPIEHVCALMNLLLTQSFLTLGGKDACALVGACVTEYGLLGRMVPDAPAIIEAELPREVNLNNFREWLKNLCCTLEALGCSLAPSSVALPNPREERWRCAMSGVSYDKGLLVVALVKPRCELHLTPAWNVANYPRSTVYFSSYNLRLQPASAALHQCVPIGMATDAVVKDAFEMKTRAVLDVEWNTQGVAAPRTRLQPHRRDMVAAQLDLARQRGFKLERLVNHGAAAVLK